MRICYNIRKYSHAIGVIFGTSAPQIATIRASTQLEIEVHHMNRQAAYPYVTRMIQKLFVEGRLSNVATVEVEPRYGYMTRLTYVNGAVRITRGNDVGLNIGASQELVNDKGYTRLFLEMSSIKCPKGETFLLDWWADFIRQRQHRPYPDTHRTVADAIDFTDNELGGFPVYVKPANGSKGRNVWCCRNRAEIMSAFDEMAEARVAVAVVEEAVPYRDSRLVFLDGRLISAYTRYPLSVTGDGRSSLRELADCRQAGYIADGRDTTLNLDDPRIAARLSSMGLTHEYVPRPLEVVQMHDISNLSAGGSAIDITNEVPERWRVLGSQISRAVGLRFCGVDLACSEISDPASDYYVLEVNATPGLDHYVSVGVEQRKVVEDLYEEVLNAFPRTSNEN